MQNILIISPSWVGDFIISQSLMVELKRCYPDSKITVFVGSWARQLSARIPEIDTFINNPFSHGKVQLLERYNLAKTLRKNNYTQVLVLPLSLKSALIPWMANIPRRIGFIGEMRLGLLTNYYRLNKTNLPRMVDRFAALANNGKKISALKYPVLKIDQDNQRLLLQKFNIKPEKLIFLCPAVEYGPSKQWPWQHFAALSAILLQKGLSVILLGAEKDRALGEKISHQLENITNQATTVVASENSPLLFYNLIGKTSLTDVIDLLALADTVVANDSGLLHIAAAAKARKIIAIYGSIPPSIAPPLHHNVQIIYLGLDCSPCGSRVCKFGHYHCLTEILPQNIADICNYN